MGFKKGDVSYWKGKKLSKEHKIKIAKSHMGLKQSKKTIQKRVKHIVGNKNHEWKNDSVGYVGLHQWVSRCLGKPDTCEHCEKSGLYGRKIHWANKSREYIRNINDWIRLCAKCHKEYDRDNFGAVKERYGNFESIQ